MRAEVVVQLVGESGEPLWGFHRDEVIVPEDDGMEQALAVAQSLLDTIDEAKASLSKQIAATAKIYEGNR